VSKAAKSSPLSMVLSGVKPEQLPKAPPVPSSMVRFRYEAKSPESV